MSTTAKSNAKSTTRRKPVQSAQERPAAQVVQFPLFAPKPRQTAPQEVQVVICECSTDAVRVRLLPDPAAVWCMMDETFGTLGWTRRYYFADGRLWCGVGVYHPLIHVRFLLDEFANIGQIPRFDKLIATIRSREMSASIILQSQSQLKAIYKDAAEIILDNADSTLFLGGRGKNAKDISDNLGRETIDSFNTSENRGTQVSHGLTYQKLGKELMTQDEIAVMDGGKCILQLRGVRPFLSDKYDITKHPNYKYLSDFDKRNAFDVERYMSTRPAIVKPDEAFDIDSRLIF